MAEGARLEIVCAFIAYRGFESLPLRFVTDEGPIVESPMAGWAIRQTLTGAAALVLSCGGSTMRPS